MRLGPTDAIDRLRTLIQRWQQARGALARARTLTEQLFSEHAETTTLVWPLKRRATLPAGSS